MTNNQDAARQGFVDALASGQHVPVTMNPFAGREPINLLTSSNTNILNGQPVLPAGAPPAQPELSDREVRAWIAEHIKQADTRGNIVILHSVEVLDADDLLFKRVQNVFGGNIVMLKADVWKPEQEPDVTSEDWNERRAQQMLQQRIAEEKFNKRYAELEAEAIERGDLPDWRKEQEQFMPQEHPSTESKKNNQKKSEETKKEGS